MGRGIVFPGNYPAALEELEELWKCYTAKEKETMQMKKKREHEGQTFTHSLFQRYVFPLITAT